MEFICTLAIASAVALMPIAMSLFGKVTLYGSIAKSIEKSPRKHGRTKKTSMMIWRCLGESTDKPPAAGCFILLLFCWLSRFLNGCFSK